MSPNLDQFIATLPKAELHIHIEGSLEPELMFTLAQRNHIQLPFASVDEVKSAYNFQNLQSFLDLYYAGAAVLRTAEDFYDLTTAYLHKAISQNVRHTEIFFDPQTHTQRGISLETVLEGLQGAIAQAQPLISAKLIMCFLRHLDADSAMNTLNQALPYQDQIIAVGLDSSELGHPPAKFTEVFAKARAAGFLTVAHAGEEGPADYIWQAINLLQVSRIDHGVRCVEDPQLVAYLAETQIPLTVCPLSNVKLRVFNTIQDHNLKQLLDAGLCVTVNSDDPSYFGGYVNENLQSVTKALNLTEQDLRQLANNSFRASFLTDTEKAAYYHN